MPMYIYIYVCMYVYVYASHMKPLVMCLFCFLVHLCAFVCNMRMYSTSFSACFDFSRVFSFSLFVHVCVFVLFVCNTQAYTLCMCACFVRLHTYAYACNMRSRATRPGTVSSKQSDLLEALYMRVYFPLLRMSVCTCMAYVYACNTCSYYTDSHEKQ